MSVDTADRLREQAVKLRNQAEHLNDQASVATPGEATVFKREADGLVVVGYALMLVAEAMDGDECE